MKKYILLWVLISSFSFAQTNEITISELINLGYEKKVSTKNSLGIKLGTGLIKNKKFEDITRFHSKVFWKYFFLKKQDFNKLYGEISFVYNTIENFPFPPESNQSHKVGQYNEGGPALGLGYKFLIKKKIVLDIDFGLGLDVIQPNKILPIFGDGGIAIGYRF